MAQHFAKVVNGIVTKVIVADQTFIDSYNDGEPGEWVETVYEMRGNVHSGGGTPKRKNYAGIGYSYDKNRQAFIPPKPFPSWTLDEQTCLWKSPKPFPQGGGWEWDEELKDWVRKS